VAPLVNQASRRFADFAIRRITRQKAVCSAVCAMGEGAKASEFSAKHIETPNVPIDEGTDSAGFRDERHETPKFGEYEFEHKIKCFRDFSWDIWTKAAPWRDQIQTKWPDFK
jgi:hypothetical protein